MTKKVALINDLSGFGKCSLTAAISVLSVMGVQACPLPTAVLSNQTGFKNFYCDDYTHKMDSYINMWQKNGAVFDGIYSGYVANEKQIDKIIEFIRVFKKPETKVIVDPVMADNGRMYSSYNEFTCNKMGELVKCADVITPNLTELCILTKNDYSHIIKSSSSEEYLNIIKNMAQVLLDDGVKYVVVTGIHYNKKIYNGVFCKNNSSFFGCEDYLISYSGTGDLFASIVCASIMNDLSVESAVEKATNFLATAIKDTVQDKIDPNHGVNFEKFLYLLAQN